MASEDERVKKLEEFFIYCLEDWIYAQLPVVNESLHVAVIQSPRYNGKRYYARGILEVGKKQYMLVVEAGSKLISVVSKPFSLSLTWEELEKCLEAYHSQVGSRD